MSWDWDQVAAGSAAARRADAQRRGQRLLHSKATGTDREAGRGTAVRARPATDTRGVLADLASSIRNWLTAELSPGTDIAFDAPHLLVQHRPPRAGLVDVFLYGITEAADGMPSAPIRARDHEGRVTGSIAPARFYHLSYLLTAWAASTEKEYELLGAVLEGHTENDVLGPEHLSGVLTNLTSGLTVRLGWSPTARSHEMWGALGIPMRSALDMTVMAPALPSRLRRPAPPVETVQLDVHDTVQRPPEPHPRWRRTSITEH